jgi:multiple sugar transport system substrate-binding protein
MTKADFENFYKPFLDKKLSGITVEFINDDGLEKQFAAGIVPDLVTAGFAQIPSVTKLDYAVDLTALVKKNNVDLSKYNQVALNGAKIYSLQSQLNAIPHKISTFGLFYNKDLFDKFGAAYPKDDMTWEEATEIAKKVSRSDGSIRYSGLQYSNNIAVFSRGVGLTLVDPKTNKAAFNNDKALKVLSVLHGIYTVPGNEWQAKILDRFLAGEVAMIPWWVQDTFIAIHAGKAKDSLNWDLASYPHFQGYNGIIEPSMETFLISKKSAHQDEAMQVIKFLTTDQEVQSLVATNGNIPVVDVPNVAQVFGSNFPEVKGKHVEGVLKSKFLENHVPSLYDDVATAAYNKYTQQYLTGALADPNTALMKAEEEANSKIAEALSR